MDVYEHPHFGSELLPLLQSFLPHSLPLYRRMQFSRSLSSPSSYVLATFSPLDLPQSLRCFAVAFIDRSLRPETDMWLFSSGDVPDRCGSSASLGGSTPSECRPCSNCTASVLSIISQVSKLPLPSCVYDSLSMSSMTKDIAYVAHVADPSILLLGSASTLVVQILQSASLISTLYPGRDMPFTKYLFRFRKSDMVQVEKQGLDNGLRWGTIRERDFSLIKSKSIFARPDETLRLLPCRAIFPSGHSQEVEENEDIDPIAWSFLSWDASVVSLFVEPEWRERGLAKILAAKLVNEEMHGIWSEEDGEVLAHADVRVENTASNRMCKSIGGMTGWTTFWVRVDLGKVENDC